MARALGSAQGEPCSERCSGGGGLAPTAGVVSPPFVGPPSDIAELPPLPDAVDVT